MNFNIINSNDKITDIELEKLLEYYNNQLPQSYIDFLKYSNGYLSINSDLVYASDEIKERNQYHKIDKYMPKYIAIGDGDDNCIFLMEKGGFSNQIFVFDSISIVINECKPEQIFKDFYEFLEYIQIDRFADESLDYYNILLIRPITDIKTILKIKKNLKYDGDMNCLLNGCRNVPFIIRKNITYGLCQVLLNSIPEISRNFKIIKGYMEDGTIT